MPSSSGSGSLAQVLDGFIQTMKAVCCFVTAGTTKPVVPRGTTSQKTQVFTSSRVFVGSEPQFRHS